MQSTKRTITIMAPAKINLILCIEGLRGDNYHNLFSVVAPIGLKDELTITLGNPGKSDALSCPNLMGDLSFMANNLILKAANSFREKTNFKASIQFVLNKHIPVGSGLGGGSSDAVAVLKGLNSFLEQPLSELELIDLSQKIGADCPFFVKNEACIIEGKGERIVGLEDEVVRKLHHQKVLLFKPDFPISTTWAYSKFREQAPKGYMTREEISTYYNQWKNELLRENKVNLINGFESVVFAKYLALPVLLEDLRNDFGVNCGMTGSGSACFAILKSTDDVEKIQHYIKSCWGENCFVYQTFIIGR